MRRTRGSRAYCGRLFVVGLCVLIALLGSACNSPDSSKNGVTIVTPAPVDSALSVFVEDQESSHVVAFRARDGSTRWTYTPQGERFTGNGLTYSNGLVYGFTFTSDHQTLVAIDAANGHIRWHARVEGFSMPRMVVTNDYVVLMEGTQQSPTILRVIRTSDGAETPDIPLTDFSGSGLAADGDTAFACANNGTLTAFDLADGQPLWHVTVAPGLAESVSPCGLKTGAGIVFATVSTGLGFVAMRERDGHRLWQKPIAPTLLTGGTGYSVVAQAPSASQPPADSLVAFRISDGTVLWQIPFDTDTSHIIGDEQTLVMKHLMGLRAVRASDGASLWSYAPPPERILYAQAVAGGLVFARSMSTVVYRFGPPPGTDVREHLLAIGADNGRLYWQMPLNPGFLAIGDAT